MKLAEGWELQQPLYRASEAKFTPQQAAGLMGFAERLEEGITWDKRVCSQNAPVDTLPPSQRAAAKGRADICILRPQRPLLG